MKNIKYLNMLNDSDANYENLVPEQEQPEEKPQVERPKNLKWVAFALVATVCFASSGYILGMISGGGIAAKFLNSIGYFFIAWIIIIVK